MRKYKFQHIFVHIYGGKCREEEREGGGTARRGSGVVRAAKAMFWEFEGGQDEEG